MLQNALHYDSNNYALKENVNLQPLCLGNKWQSVNETHTDCLVTLTDDNELKCVKFWVINGKLEGVKVTRS